MPTETTAHPCVPAGIWRRLVAFVLDGLLIGVVGMVIGSFSEQQLVDLGPWGRLLGFAVAAAYFGVFNSRVANGQTLGKRLLKIKVIRRDGKLLSVPESVLRFVPLGAPWFLNNAQFPQSVLFSSWIYVISALVFGVGLSIVYLFFFNRRSRQSAHDLLVGSYVVAADASNAATIPGTWRPHLILCSLLVAISAALPFFTKGLSSQEPFASLINVWRAVQTEPWVVHTMVNKGKSFSTNAIQGRGPTSYLNITAFSKDPDVANAERATRVARLALSVDPSATSLEVVQVTLVYGYDIGIANSWKHSSLGRSPVEWAKSGQ
jgi:uncharacterized RDD family membrane protein YckC